MSTTTLGLDEARTRLETIMREDAPFEAKAEQALELGMEYLGVQNGHVTQIVPETDYWEAIISTDSSDGRFPVGNICDLRRTYCRRTVQQESPIALHDAPNQDWADDPAFQEHELDCYHGSTIIIDDETFGTVCFVSEESREPFTDAESMFAEFIATHLERDLERRRHSDELTRQSNLVNVLNRVLRHNLRNGMAVIRGYANGIAEDSDERMEAAETIVKRTDRLIELSEKARKLESVIADETERQETDLDTLLGRVREQVDQNYPAASVTIEGKTELSLAVRPSLKTALHELVENAAKHAGDEPVVTVTVEPTPNEVAIEVSDNGPGLADIEQRVLSEGAETSLEHGEGLGLWLAYWVVSCHDGDITVDVCEEGTRMQLTLPREMTAPGMDRLTRDVSSVERVQDQFRAVFNEAFDAMVILNNDGTIIDANRSSANLLGIAPTELLGQHIDRFAAADRERVLVDEVGQITDYELVTVPIERVDGTKRVVEFTLTTDIVSGQHLCVMRDITDQRKHQRALTNLEQGLQTVLSNVPVVFWTTDETGVFTRSEGSALTRLGLEPGDVVGESVFDIYEDYPRVCDHTERALAGERVATTVQLDGIVFDTWHNPLTTADGDIIGTVGLAYDVTDRPQRTPADDEKRFADEN